ncbi:MAG: L-seryl-tRNA(Sec) selenium transferase [Anaerolineae bacterium]|nr:L-seryl-tRNA(Sec) selenium transferase [Anaerolineae bacterium]
MQDLSVIPPVNELLSTHTAAELIAEYGRPLTLEAIRQCLTDIRAEYKEAAMTVPLPGEMLQRARKLLSAWARPTVLPVVNATGVILHTNLGRAPLSREAIQAVQGVAVGYSNLEYDLEAGRRGSRYTHAEDLLKRLTGAEAALVVNNNAGALLLALSALARRRRVLIARTQLIEIGGGFRIPEVMKQSGAKLVEIGATNRVHLADYQQALDEQPIVMVLRAHRSNFRIEGFTSEPDLDEITTLSRAAAVPFLDDLGSGSLIDTARYGLKHETTVQESLAGGADLVCFSGDKLLGGPQAGILVGRADLVAKLKKHPVARAIRADKLALAALSATLLHYLKDEAERKIPIWQMVSTSPEMVRSRAHAWAEQLGTGTVIPGESAIGGGSLPGETLPTYLLALDIPAPQEFLQLLRQAHPPVIARMQDEQVVFDPRTVSLDQEGALLVGVQNSLSALRAK